MGFHHKDRKNTKAGDTRLELLEIEGAGEFEQDGPIIQGGVQLALDFPEDKEDVVSGSVDVVEPKIEGFDLGRIVVLKGRGGDELGAQGVIQRGINEMTGELSLWDLDLVQVIAQVEDQRRHGFPLRKDSEGYFTAAEETSLGRELDAARQGP